MPVSGTVQLSNEVKALYDAQYMLTGQSLLYWDPLANLRKVMNGVRGSTYEFPIGESLQPTATALSELNDVTPQAMNASSSVTTLQEWGGAVQLSNFLAATSYVDVYEQAAYMNGYSMAESIDNVVRAVAGQGSRQFFQNGRTARSAFTGPTTAADRMTASFLEQSTIWAARTTKIPPYEDGTYCAVMHPAVHYDLLQTASDVRAMSIRVAPELLFNGELSYWAGLRIVVPANAKAFWGAGAANASAVNTTLATAANPGDGIGTSPYSTLKVAANTNMVVGGYLTILDAAETGNTWTDTNELFYPTVVGTGGAGGTGISGWALDSGPGDNGGIRYAHASGTTVTNNYAVFPTVILGPNSLVKAASDLTGPYGMTVVTGPFDNLGRFPVVGWYLIAGWSRTKNGWLMRLETGSSII